MVNPQKCNNELTCCPVVSDSISFALPLPYLKLYNKKKNTETHLLGEIFS